MWHFTLLYNFPCEREKKTVVLACLIFVTLSPLFSIFTQWLMDFVWRWTLSDTLFFISRRFSFKKKNQIIWVKKPQKTSPLVVPLVQMSYCLSASAYVSVSRKSALMMSHQLLFPFVCLVCHVPYGLCYYPATDTLIDDRYIMMCLHLLTGRVKRGWNPEIWLTLYKKNKNHSYVFDLPR